MELELNNVVTKCTRCNEIINFAEKLLHFCTGLE